LGVRNSQVSNPFTIIEGFVNSSVAVHHPRCANSLRVLVPPINRRRGLTGLAVNRRHGCSAGGSMPYDILFGGDGVHPLSGFERIGFDVHDVPFIELITVVWGQERASVRVPGTTWFAFY